jgi:phosphopentomutase
MPLMPPTAVLLVADACGVPTIKRNLKITQESFLPELQRLGLGNLLSNYIPPNPDAQLAVAVEQESVDADSVIGHREMVGLVDRNTYNVFPQGFSSRFIGTLERATGKGFFFNEMAGGSDAIKENHAHHAKTGEIILYSSLCDPVAQFAAHEDIIPQEELAEIADRALEIGVDLREGFTRAISRPYVGNEGEFARTANRHDAVLPLNRKKTLVDVLRGNNIWVAGVGKFPDLVPSGYDVVFKEKEAGRVADVFTWGKDDTNPYSFNNTLQAVQQAHQLEGYAGAVILVNLVDTDSLYGHAPGQEQGWRNALHGIDTGIGMVQAVLQPGDVLMVSADHGMMHQERMDKPGEMYGYHQVETLPFLGTCKDGILQPPTTAYLTDVGGMIARVFGRKVSRQYQSEVLAQNR